METLSWISLVGLMTSVLLRTGHALLDIGEICSSTAECISNAECRFDGGNSEIARCLCKYSYTHIDDGATETCAEVIHDDIDPTCTTCESNGGVCYDSDGNNNRDGCVCPSFTSGTDCIKSHVTVTCNATEFTMVVCYEPQADYFFNESAVLLTEGFGMDTACKGVLAKPTDTQCTPGHYKLNLPLRIGARERCGTKKLMSDITTTKYQNTIFVQHRLEDLQLDDISFTTSCSFDTHANSAFSPIGLAVVNAHDRGQHHKPTLNFLVENHLGNPIPEGVALRLGDKIRFRIRLTDDGTYTAIHVLRCIASTRATIPDLNAFTIPLILSSCPSSGQTHFTNANNWLQVNGQMNELQTGLVRMFKMPEGRSVHLHCAVRLCLKGSELDCAAVPCSSPVPHDSFGRRKRSDMKASNPRLSEMSVSRVLPWYQEESYGIFSSAKTSGANSTSTLAYILVICAMAIALTVFIALVISTAIRLSKRNSRALLSSTC